MKNFLIAIVTILLFACSCKTFTQITQGIKLNAVTNETPLPSGTYYIVNNNLALTPPDAMPGQNVFLKPFNRGGLQQWIVTRSGTGKNISYTLRLAGETDGLWFQPYAVKEHTPVVGSRSGNISLKIVPVPNDPAHWYIKSVRYNGDAMHSYLFSRELPMEIRFDPAEENSSKYLWQFEAVKE